MHLSSKSTAKPLLEAIRPTTFIDSLSLKRALDLDVIIASESFQITGSFKFRAAYNLALHVRNELLITASSGNFGQALSCACYLLGKSCIVVMPSTAARIKIESTKRWGATVDLVDTKEKTRAARVAELAKENPQAYVASAYDDLLVIEGNATLGLEIGNSNNDVDFVIAPIGGGGLSSGIITGVGQSRRPHISVFAAEPALANDAAQSMACGRLVSLDQESETIADGARTLSVGKHNFEILKSGLAGVIEVSEELIEEAVRLCFAEANLKVEPTGALAVGALLAQRKEFVGKKLMCVVSGANVDASLYARLISRQKPEIAGP